VVILEPTSGRVASQRTKAVVRHGWNRVSRIYRSEEAVTDVFGHAHLDYQDWLEPVLRSIAHGSEVLDLGCGCGVPAARILARRFRVTGVDISDVQVRRARQIVPQAKFVRRDMTEVDFPEESFGAVVCLYAIIHVPLEEQRPLLTRVFRWLAPGGLFLLIAGEEAWTGEDENWLGSNVKMYWSHADAGTYLRWLTQAGFAIERRSFVPEGRSGHVLILAHKP
jgi:SAM-dependent methyltransferase